jgi:amidase
MAMPALSLPGLNVPVGIAKGLPVGVQLVADSFREHLAAGAVIERAAVMPRVYD